MTPEEKLTRELKELKRLTGISFSIDENETADTADIAEKIKLLSDAFREKNKQHPASEAGSCRHAVRRRERDTDGGGHRGA